MNNSFEDQYLDVLHNIETAIVEIGREHPGMLDLDVENALNALIRTYRAEADDRPASPPRLSEMEEEIYEGVKSMCELRLGHAELTTKDGQPVNLPIEPLAVEEIVACLKRIQHSVRRWSKRHGRRGYLDFVQQFIP
ncbi:MAG: hypothetical protein JXB30_05005 [Anaerolineae bacterium]|nr:hypothetical protein [Anaerolineae bacterium]